jgi:hypothetical protein
LSDVDEDIAVKRSTVAAPDTEPEPAMARIPDASPTVEVAPRKPFANRRALKRSWWLAAAFVLPYFLLGVAFVGSNPPGAAPDEPDHFVKALGVGHLDIGSKLTGVTGATPIERRNIALTRIVKIPARLSPDGYACFAFKVTQTAACLPRTTPRSGRTIQHPTTMGSYPPFGYVLPGIAARQANTPYRAFLAARIVGLIIASFMLLLGAFHLIRWLGRWALLGAFIGLTPMAVFASSVVSTSGLEIMSAFALATVVVVATRRPESLRDTGTLLTLTAAGSALVLSRQLGIVTLSVLLLTLLGYAGWRTLWQVVKDRTTLAVGCLAVLVTSIALLVGWELVYDRPVETGTFVSRGAWTSFLGSSFDIVRSGIGVFGWLDAPLPRWSIAVWVILSILLCGMALILGNRRDRWTLGLVLAATYVVTYITYATAFYPISASLQGRHVLPLFVFSPLFAGVIVVERLKEIAPEVMPRLFAVIAVMMGAIQFVGVYWNGHRYAVGTKGGFLYVFSAEWSPRFGWVPWLILAAVASAFLIVFAAQCRPNEGRLVVNEVRSVER